MGFKLFGLDEFKGKLNKMEKSFKQLNERKGVSFDDLFTKSFMENYTNFLTFNDFLKASNFVVNSQEDFEAIPNIDMDNHVSKTTNFSSWKEMLNSAHMKYLKDQLDF